MRVVLLTVLLSLAGCAAPGRDARPQEPAAPPAQPATAAAAPAEDWAVTSSRLEIRVYSEGPLKRLGHDHVIVSEALGGRVELRETLEASRFELALPLDSLVVDDPAARARAGPAFAEPVPPEDRAATRRNMLGESVLDAAARPVLGIAAEEISGSAGQLVARVRVSLGGEEHLVTAPFSLVREGGVLRAESSFTVTHAALGLEPFSIALGALRVADGIGIGLRLEARPAT